MFEYSFSCTGTEAQEPYFSPPPQVTTFSPASIPGIPEILSPPLSPPGVVPRGPQRNMAKTAALKLVTSFGDKNSPSKFFGAGGSRTPMNNGATPIAESALSPGSHDTSQTAFLRPSQRSVYNTPASARTATPGGFSRGRLPSIGETPTDVTPARVKLAISRPTTDEDTSSEVSTSTNGHSSQRQIRKASGPEIEQVKLNSATYNPVSRASTASPMMQKSKSTAPANPLPSPSPEMFTQRQLESRTRNGSRDRKPDGLQIQWPPMESIITGDYMTTPELSGTSSLNKPPVAHSVANAVAGSIGSVSVSGRSERSERSHRSHGVASPVLTGRSLDQYISSLESAQYTKPKQRSRQASRDAQDHRSGRGRSSSRKPKAREPSTERGRSGARFLSAGKRSPTSPVPMSPEDIRDMMPAFGTQDDEKSETTSNYSSARRTRTRDGSQATAIPGSKNTSRVRRMSPIRTEPISRPASRTARAGSRRASPDASLSSQGRGRSKIREGAIARSPSSPLPMSPSGRSYYTFDNKDDKDLQAAKADQERFRSRQRSVSRARERGQSTSRHVSPDRKNRARSSSRHGTGREPSSSEDVRRGRRAPLHKHSSSDLKAGDIHQIKTERQRKKEAAARELEERRRSLVRRPSAPTIVHPEQLSPMIFRPASRTEGMQMEHSTSLGIIRSQTVSPESMRQASGRFQEPQKSSSAQVGLPATPRAMQHPKYDSDNKDVPEVPQIPESYNSFSQTSMGSVNELASSDAPEAFAPLPQTTFVPLPRTTYSAAPRHIPPRSMSAPIPEEPSSPKALPAGLPTHPAFQAALPPSSRHRDREVEDMSRNSPSRKVNPGDAQPGTLGYEARNNPTAYTGRPIMMGGIDETIEADARPLNPNNNNLVPPPPPPPPEPTPPILRELQHLAMPPVPPPAPLYRMVTTNNGQPVGPRGTGIIEIVMDGDEETSPAESRPTSGVLPPQSLPTLEPRTTHSVHHSRGRSITDNSISGRFARASERIRSASRGTSPQLTRTKSPSISLPMEHAPHEGMTTQKWVMEQVSRAPVSISLEKAEGDPPDVNARMMGPGGMI